MIDFGPFTNLYEAQLREEAVDSLSKHAKKIGKEDYKSGLKAAPAQSEQCMDLLKSNKGLSLHEQMVILQSWHNGWYEANAADDSWKIEVFKKLGDR